MVMMKNTCQKFVHNGRPGMVDLKRGDTVEYIIFVCLETYGYGAIYYRNGFGNANIPYS